MKRIMVVVGVLLLGVGAVSAQQDVVNQRQKVMKANGKNLGGVLGALDGLTALLSAPEVKPEIMTIVAGSTGKGLLAGLLIGFISRKVNDLTASIVFGVLVAALTPSGPAARAGLRPGDVVVAAEGKAVKTSSELTRAVARTKPGDTVRLEVVREGQRRTIRVRTEVRPSERALARRGD